MYIFGGGDAYFTPKTNTSPNPTPMQLFALQECSIDFSATSKPMMGKQQFPLAVARAEGKIAIKVKFGNQYLKLWNDVFFKATTASGSTIGVPRESHNAATSVTVVPPNSGVFLEDLGVQDATTGKQMTLVASAPAAGVSYSVTGAAYTFGAGQGAMLISYLYTATTGFNSAITNQPMGSMPVGELVLINTQFQNLDGSQNALVRLPAVLAIKMTIPGKNADWLYNEMDMEGYADSAGNVAYISMDE